MMENNYILFLITFAVSFLGTIYYRNFAIKNNILANLNFRTLHEKPTPRGGGVVFSGVFVSVVFLAYFTNQINLELMMVLGVGSGFAAIIGYIDDLNGIKPLNKLFLQTLLALWILYFFKGGPLINNENFPVWLGWLISLFFLVWLINAYNFIDGIDGFAITGAILILSTLISTLVISNSSSILLLLFPLLLASCLGFLFFNWPSASIFMGDSGSIFLGYCFGAFIIYSLIMNEISFYTWLVVFGYYLSDTSITTITRSILVKKWYHTHRSHAYQNLARLLNNHAKVTVGVGLFHLFWLLPLAVFTVLMPKFSIIAVFFAYMPSIFWALKFGPLFSQD